jgi:predicted nucleic acid-binding protein
MEKNVLADAGFLVALLHRRDAHHDWAATLAARLPPPWQTCEAVLSESFQLLGERGSPALTVQRYGGRFEDR